MQVFNNGDYQIFYEASKKLLLCYKNNSFYRQDKLLQKVENYHELRDAARDFFETWIEKKPKPHPDSVSY